ncbi:hypothetical protein FA15DRAFT_655868 [Coprinopsis marcescibilis]|uniref:Uncharacterized protein n=1 Tax=Coprinopsis marcescibilis TaxID=230819 RepID=A0A5C3KW24_COPMA|nr:hypothetical protein FA15DRAFT_655868 [Coprinopsis marcescibilis]
MDSHFDGYDCVLPSLGPLTILNILILAGIKLEKFRWLFSDSSLAMTSCRMAESFLYTNPMFHSHITDRKEFYAAITRFIILLHLSLDIEVGDDGKIVPKASITDRHFAGFIEFILSKIWYDDSTPDKMQYKHESSFLGLLLGDKEAHETALRAMFVYNYIIAEEGVVGGYIFEYAILKPNLQADPHRADFDKLMSVVRNGLPSGAELLLSCLPRVEDADPIVEHKDRPISVSKKNVSYKHDLSNDNKIQTSKKRYRESDSTSDVAESFTTLLPAEYRCEYDGATLSSKAVFSPRTSTKLAVFR